MRRRGRYRPEDFARLQLGEPFDLPAAKQEWLEALEAAEAFARARPPGEFGCLYYSSQLRRFVLPDPDTGLTEQGIGLHFGQPEGVLPRIAGARIDGLPEG